MDSSVYEALGDGEVDEDGVALGLALVAGVDLGVALGVALVARGLTSGVASVDGEGSIVAEAVASGLTKITLTSDSPSGMGDTSFGFRRMSIPRIKSATNTTTAATMMTAVFPFVSF